MVGRRRWIVVKRWINSVPIIWQFTYWEEKKQKEEKSHSLQIWAGKIKIRWDSFTFYVEA